MDDLVLHLVTKLRATEIGEENNQNEFSQWQFKDHSKINTKRDFDKIARHEEKTSRNYL